MYRFSKQLDLLIADLLRNTYKLLKPRTEWSGNLNIFNWTVVSPYAILVAVHVQEDNREELHLLRITKDGDDYERILLHCAQEGIVHSAYALVEITGEGVDVKRRVVHGGWGGPIVFLTVDINEPRTVAVDNVVPPFGQSEDRKFDVQLSTDGRELLAIHEVDPHVLQVYSLAERKWTHELDGLDVGNDPFFWYRFSPNDHIYGENFGDGDGEFLFVCNLERKKWEKKAIRARDVGDLAFIVDPVDGREHGLVICRFKQQPRNARRQRFKVERHMFRQPDSLQRQAFMAARKLQEGVEVEETLRQMLESARKAQATDGNEELSSAAMEKKFFPSAYDGMTPIAIRFH
ncbi:hypothetical protein M3Y99_01906700 [Aphelenchoides fujianensis]|nr:hypothetical protein M3Y99_01906700 [Aphelenchoides fujianensis]